MALTRINLNFIEDQIRAGTLVSWNANVGYADVPSFAVGSDGLVYRSTTANGVDVDGNDIGPGAVDPVNDETGVWEEFATTGATGGGRDKVFYENDQTVTESYTITTGRNAMTAGPVNIGVELTIANVTSDGSEITLDTTTPHNMKVGDQFDIKGTTNYNGVFTVNTVVDVDTVTALSNIVAPFESVGTAAKVVLVEVPLGSEWTVV